MAELDTQASSWLAKPAYLHEPTVEERINGIGEQVKETMQKMSPGDSLHIERHEPATGSGAIFTLTVKNFGK